MGVHKKVCSRPHCKDLSNNQRCVTKTLLLLSVTMAPACARLDLLEMTLQSCLPLHCWTPPPPGSDGRYGTEGCLCWRWPNPREVSLPSSTPLSTESSPTGMIWRRSG